MMNNLEKINEIRKTSVTNIGINLNNLVTKQSSIDETLKNTDDPRIITGYMRSIKDKHNNNTSTITNNRKRADKLNRFEESFNTPIPDSCLTTRCQKNLYRLNKKNHYDNAIREQTICSRLEYNQGLFCCRTWNDTLYNIILEQHANQIDANIEKYSPNDKLALLKYFFYKKDLSSIKKILSYTRKWDKKYLQPTINRIEELFGKDNVRVNIIETPLISYEYDNKTTSNTLKALKINDGHNQDNKQHKKKPIDLSHFITTIADDPRQQNKKFNRYN